MSPGISIPKYCIPFSGVGSGMSAGETAIRAGNTVAWYDSSDLTTITKDGGDFVSLWKDKLLSGHDLAQATGTNQPKWVLNDGVLFDGVDNWLRVVFSYPNPRTIYMVVSQVTWTLYDTLIDGVTSGEIGIGQRAGPSPTISLYDFSNPSNELVLNTWGIIRVKASNIEASLQVNENALKMSAGYVVDVGGVTLGSYSFASDYFANIKVRELILRNVVDSAGDGATIYAYLKTKYGL